MRAIILLMFVIALSALALFSATDVVTVLDGSHTIRSLTSDTNDVNCTGCHQKMRDQLDNSSIHSGFDCEECHRMTKTAGGKVVKYATHNDSGVTVGNESHAAYTPRCLDCHGGNGVYYNDSWTQKQAPTAKAFNETYGSNYSAHKPFVKQALDWGLSKGENEACIACHTNYSMKVNYKYWYNINYSVSGYDVPFDSFSDNGTRNYNITYDNSGNKHKFVNSSDINCVSCHKNIYDALVNGTDSGSNEDYLTHAPIEINATEWDTDNPWNHSRYHYIDSNRAERVNNSYCFECHNVNKYANNNPNEATTYNLTDTEVINDTNSTDVHIAEALWCQTCHGSGKTKEVIDNPERKGSGHNNTSPDFVDEVKNNYARTFHGDICMGCHEAAVHPDSSCGRCHKKKKSNADVYIESEPSGYATNTK